MTENDPQSEIDDSKRQAGEDLGELDAKGDDLEERLEQNEAMSEDIEVPEPNRGESLSISDPPDDDSDEGSAQEAGVDEGAVPEDQGEAANEAGQ